MKSILICIALFTWQVAQAAKPTSSYLSCKGTMLAWTGSFTTRPEGMDNENATMVIKLAPNSATATLTLTHVGEQVLNLTTDGENYYGYKKLDATLLDRHVSSVYITINRINGKTHAGLWFEGPIANDGRWLFDGICEPAAAKF